MSVAESGEYVYYKFEDEPVNGWRITFQAIEEFEDFDKAHDMEDIEWSQVKDEIDRGTMVYFTAVVKAERRMSNYPRNASGTAYLGACVYHSYEEFHTTCHAGYYKDMVHEALELGAVNEAELYGRFVNLNQVDKLRRRMEGDHLSYIRLERYKAGGTT